MKWYIKVLKQYADFKGKANRKEFWLFVLINILVLTILSALLGQSDIYAARVIITLYFFATLIPSLAVTVRRLHDGGNSGWWILIGLIPVIGYVWLFILLIKGSRYEEIIDTGKAILLEQNEVNNTASVKEMKCPQCNNKVLTILGVKYSEGVSLATTIAFGAIGNIIAGKYAAKNKTTSPIQYKCDKCKNKFISPPLEASPEEILPEACKITFRRVGNFAGAWVPQMVYLNGIKIGAVKNGKMISFYTSVKSNTLFVTDQHGVAFKSYYNFEAQPGENRVIPFNRKFYD